MTQAAPPGLDYNANKRTPYAMPFDLDDVGMPAGALDDVDYNAQLKALNAASDIVDSYLRDQYTVPLCNWGTDIRLVTCSIASYYLITRRGFNPEGSDLHFRARYDDAISWLKDVARGHASISGNRLGDAPPVEGLPIMVSHRDRRGW